LEGVANEIFDKMVEFAAYSFNKSHAVAYTLISYWCMYLKVHYTLELMTAILSHYKETSAPLYVKECGRLKIKVLKPDINLSGAVYTITSDNEILAPLGVIKGVGTKAVETILGARAERSFISLEDMVDRIDRRKCNSRIQGIMVRAGAFESLGLWEPSKGKREKAYAELLPIFNKLPSLDKEGEKVDKKLIEYLYEEIGACCASKSESKKVLAAKSGARPGIMVINAPVKGESEHLTNKGTKHFLNIVKPLGFTPKDFYYTSPVKCFHKLAKDVTKECHGKCRDFLRQEIEIVRPKLIICFTTNVLDMFVSDKKPSMGKLHGRVVYNKEFDTYVLFSYSPQYAFYSEDVAGAKFIKAMATLADIFC
jgi:DNA polymerase-3 subunit alpha